MPGTFALIGAAIIIAVVTWWCISESKGEDPDVPDSPGAPGVPSDAANPDVGEIRDAVDLAPELAEHPELEKRE